MKMYLGERRNCTAPCVAERQIEVFTTLLCNLIPFTCLQLDIYSSSAFQLLFFFLHVSYQVPTILNALQRSVQAVLVGKIQIQDWFGNGIKRAAQMNKWVLKEVAIDEDEHCLLQTDGSFLYLLCKDGLYKVGSGYSGTVRVCRMHQKKKILLLCLQACFTCPVFKV